MVAEEVPSAAPSVVLQWVCDKWYAAFAQQSGHQWQDTWPFALWNAVVLADETNLDDISFRALGALAEMADGWWVGDRIVPLAEWRAMYGSLSKEVQSVEQETEASVEGVAG